ncbi:hypothetical protein [Roseibium salinum]|uniref:Cysteine rich repeat-containing protein n=1 Tax=Roseibium salinum TaxID=1604349 RepID=A0ABT3QY24_9HYPH|nr:hypothetical protein [Roseibium sp. DSM 29163]MCX2721741.1 hypothetical protein [Roseibium sp. DSM 29163]MDN3720208.1 hypothetical protein [Roseibium salinum]
MRFAGLRTLFAIVIVAGLPQVASAQTVGFADAIKILAASCGKDITAHCESASLANNGIMQCLDQNQAKVSQQCNADRAVVAGLIQARLAAQAEAPKVCQRDAAQYCKGVKPGAGHILRCLLKAEPSVSKKCNTAIDLAGYR